MDLRALGMQLGLVALLVTLAFAYLMVSTMDYQDRVTALTPSSAAEVVAE